MHGLTTPDSDQDIRYITRMPLRDIISPFKNDDVKVANAEGQDVESWELRHFVKHLCQGNPTMYEVIKTPYFWSESDWDASEIRSIMPLAFDATKIVFAHIGYAEAQLSRYLRKAKNMFSFNPELKYVHDIWEENQYRRIPKSIVAAYRVLAQGEQLLLTGDFQPKIKDYSPELHDKLMAIKTMDHNDMTSDFINHHLDEIEKNIQGLKQTYTNLNPEIKDKKPDIEKIVDILSGFYN